ncbi:MAG: hypothetical protein JWN24_4142, partial [Phycisphaerales bacterium]|nr:hypothetical protein [Phycisphaerales bacterium]
MNLTVTNSAEVIFNSQQTFSSLTLSGSAKAVASTGGGGTSANSL